MKSCLYNTDSGWIEILRGNSIRDGVNFWRKDKRRFNLPVGSSFYFKVRGVSQIAGRAIFSGQRSMSIGAAWERYGIANGVVSELELRRRAEEVIGIDDGDEINCLLLDGIQMLEPGEYVSLLVEEFPPQVMASKFFEEDQIARIEAKFNQLCRPLPLPVRDLVAALEVVDELLEFDPASIFESKKFVMRSIAQRRGQSLFRQRLLTAYGGRCAVTGTSAVEVLEAAHIFPYQGVQTNVVQNGILLRADWHTLFDLGYWTLSPNLEIIVSDALESEEYRSFHGRSIFLPKSPADRPSLLSIERRSKEFFA